MPSLETIALDITDASMGATAMDANKAKTAAKGSPGIDRSKQKENSAKKKKASPNQRGIASFFAPRRTTSVSNTIRSPGAKVTFSPTGSGTGSATKTPSAPDQSRPHNDEFKGGTKTYAGMEPPTKDTVTARPTRTAVTPGNKGRRPRYPDRNQIMEIVLGTTLRDDGVMDKPVGSEPSPEHPITLDSQTTLPIPGIRNPGLGKEPKRTQVTPSPSRTSSPTNTHQAAEKEDIVSVKLLGKLEKTVEGHMDEKECQREAIDLQPKDETSVPEDGEDEVGVPNSEMSSIPERIKKASGMSSIPERIKKTPPEHDPSSTEVSNIEELGDRIEPGTNARLAADSSEKVAEAPKEVINSVLVYPGIDQNVKVTPGVLPTRNSTPQTLGTETNLSSKLSSKADDAVQYDRAPRECSTGNRHQDDLLNQPQPDDVPAGIKSDIKKHCNMRSRYRRRFEELGNRGQEGLEEENFSLPKPVDIASETLISDGTSLNSQDGEFPDEAVRGLAVVIQGSHLTLTELADSATELLQRSFYGLKFTAEEVMSKIKLLATRESYVMGNLTGPSNSGTSKTNVSEDSGRDRMWRWELTSLDLLPDQYISKVKKARSARRKLRTHQKAISKLLLSLDEADALFLDSSSTKERRDSLLARIGSEEEKVLKYEREVEKHRIAKEAKKKKEQARIKKENEKRKEKEQKVKEKELAEEEKRKEKAQRQAEKERQKQQAARAREELKREKEAEREEERKKEQLEKEEQEKKIEAKKEKQRAIMKSFLAGPTRKSSPNGKEAKPQTAVNRGPTDGFDTEQFRSLINSSVARISTGPLQRLSQRAIASRSRRTSKVSVTVFETVIPDNPFTDQPYYEQKEIQVRNKYKFLSFKEDHRPPYHGTWSKPRSSTITGRTPTGKDTTFLDYDLDSEAEWEEGDDDPGEDCEDDTGDDEEENMEDEEGDTRVYNYQDGWLTHDDDLGREGEIDAETVALRKKKLDAASKAASNGKKDIEGNIELSTVCVISPTTGGLPLSKSDIMTEGSELVEGVSRSTALEFLASHEGTICSPDIGVCWETFPPHLVEEGKPTTSDPSSNPLVPVAGGGKGKCHTSTQEMSKEALKRFVQFVHNCTLPSKEKVVEQLRTLHTDISSSRARATRKLDAIAVKKRNPSGGVVWEVKRTILEELGLEKLLAESLVAQPERKEKSISDSTNTCTTPPDKRDKVALTNTGSGKNGKRKREPATSNHLAVGNAFAAFLKKRKVPK